MKTLILAACAAAALSTASYAEDEKKFNGFYLGGEVGTLSNEGSSLSYGGVLGYRFQSDSDWVVGADLFVGDLDENYFTLFSQIRGSVGKVVGSGNGLVFGEVGYMEARAELFGVTVDDGGFNIGGGYEHAFGAFSVRLKGGYASFGDGADGFIGSMGLFYNF